MSIVLVLLICTATSDPVCTEFAWQTAGWQHCLATLEHHALRTPDDAGRVFMTFCTEGEPGFRRVSGQG